MKSETNPQPQAVERINKIHPTAPEHSKPKGERVRYKNSNKEIYLHESEQQAWSDVLKKNHHPR